MSGVSIELLIKGLIAILGPFAIWGFEKPEKEEKCISRLWASLSKILMFRMSQDIAMAIPVKNLDVEDEDYRLLCRESLHNYLSQNSGVLYDLLKCKRLVRQIISLLRGFKYSAISISILGVIFVGMMLNDAPNKKMYIDFCIILIVLMLFVFLLTQRMKDRFKDMCVAYEVIDVD